MTIKKTILEKLAKEQEVIRGKFGKDSNRMYDDLSQEVKDALKGFPVEIIAGGGKDFETYIVACGHKIV